MTRDHGGKVIKVDHHHMGRPSSLVELENWRIFDQTQWSQQSDINLLLTFSRVKQFRSFESGRDSIYGAHKLSDLSVKNSSPPRVSLFVFNFGIILN